MFTLSTNGSSGEVRPGSDAIFWYRRDEPWDAVISPALSDGLAANVAGLRPAQQFVWLQPKPQHHH